MKLNEFVLSYFRSGVLLQNADELRHVEEAEKLSQITVKAFKLDLSLESIKTLVFILSLCRLHVI